MGIYLMDFEYVQSEQEKTLKPTGVVQLICTVLIHILATQQCLTKQRPQIEINNNNDDDNDDDATTQTTQRRRNDDDNITTT